MQDAKRYLSWPAFHLQGDCRVHPKLKVGYVYVPRTGTATMKADWRDVDKICYEGILVEAGYIKSNYFKHDYSDFYWFTVIREPISRFKSCVVRCHYLYPKLEKDVSKIIEMLPQRKFCVLERQSWFIAGIEFDYVCEFEALESDLDKIAKIIGIDNYTIPRFNVSTESKCTLSAQDIERLKEFYASDFLVYQDSKRILKKNVAT